MLWRATFDEPYNLGWTDAQVCVGDYLYVESGLGYALDRSGVVTPFIVPGITFQGHTNVSTATGGHLRAWVTPYWSSSLVVGDGGGPGTDVALFELDAVAGSSLQAVWTLQASADGTALVLIAQTDTGSVPLLQAPIAWQANTAHLVQFNFGPQGTALILDGQLAAQGAGTLPLPPQAAQLVVGSTPDGLGSVGGAVDEVFSLDRPLTVDETAFYWRVSNRQAILGPIASSSARSRQPGFAATMNDGVPAPPGDGGDDDGGDDSGGGTGGTPMLVPAPPCATHPPAAAYICNLVSTNRGSNSWVSFHVGGTNTGIPYDVFRTTNLLAYNVTNSQWYLVDRYFVGSDAWLTNEPAGNCFYILGATNDTDGGGFSDAYERWVTHGDTNDPSDDYLPPFVGIRVTDSVAYENDPSNPAAFAFWRRGGYRMQPLTVCFQLSGTATNGVDYTLSSVTNSGTNFFITFPPFETNFSVTLTPTTGHTNIVGTQIATLTLNTNSPGYVLEPNYTNASAWILEGYSRQYTTVADFNLGVMDGLEAVKTPADATDDGHLRFQPSLPPQFPFINVACSDHGTVARINTTNGMVLGEYATAPLGLAFTGVDSPMGPSPSRTTVDQYGNVWVANRDDDRLMSDGSINGSITRIGLIIPGTGPNARFSKTNGVFSPDANGRYVAISNALYNTCIDRDGDGFICTSTGLSDVLPWNNSAGVDSDGGVSTAEDEAITEYVRVPCQGARAIAVDRYNDVWVGGYLRTGPGSQPHEKIDGLTARAVPGSVFDPGAGGYGAVIDGLGNFWSSGDDSEQLLWLILPTSYPPIENTNWFVLTAANASMYGIAVDPVHPYIWQTSGSSVFRWLTNGTPETNLQGIVFYTNGFTSSQGLAVDTNGHVWVAHQKSLSHTVGHLNTNGLWVGNVDLQVSGLYAEYFTNTTLGGWPAATGVEGRVDFSSTTNNWPPAPLVPSLFSARWSGVISPQAQGDHVFYVSAEAGAAFRLRVNGAMLIDNWAQPATNAVELAATNWLGTNVAYDIRLEYAHFSGAANLTLSWQEPGLPKEVVPPESFLSQADGGIHGATGISVDAAGKIWAACYDASTAVRIDPHAGPLSVTSDGQTNHVGLVDMVVGVGVDAHPYNYSDMTGFNARVVNPSLKPLKGYWMVVNDSGNAGQLWNLVSWTSSTNDCTVEVYVRASDDRPGLGSAIFVQATNHAAFPAIRGRFIEVRLSMTRDDASKQPAVYDLTLYGRSSGFAGDYFLYDQWVAEGGDATFLAGLVGAAPTSYQWFIQYPWMTNAVVASGATNASFSVTNVDSWVNGYVDAFDVFHGTQVSCLVSNGVGESVWLGPAFVQMDPAEMSIPATNYPSGQGPATRYPATINVFGQPTNIASVIVTLWGLNHTRSADLNFLLVSPSGTRIILMSNVGGVNSVSGSIIAFRQDAFLPVQHASIPPGGPWPFQPSNYGQKTPQVPFGLPAGPYSSDLQTLQGENPNGVWSLYIYDNVLSGIGQLTDSWSLAFTFQ